MKKIKILKIEIVFLRINYNEMLNLFELSKDINILFKIKRIISLSKLVAFSNLNNNSV